MSSFETIFQPKEAVALPALFNPSMNASAPIKTRHLLIEAARGLARRPCLDTWFINGRWEKRGFGQLVNCFFSCVVSPLKTALEPCQRGAVTDKMDSTDLFTR